MRTGDMFEAMKPPRQAPRRLMHVCDAGNSPCGAEDGSSAVVKFACRRCGHESEWMLGFTVTEAKRGIPCPVCNVE